MGDQPDELMRMLTALDEFAKEREWSQFHTVRNLVLALSGEVGELAAEVQWISDSDVDQWLTQSDHRSRIEAELIDVLNYVLMLSARLDIDIPAAFDKKLAENQKRYSPDLVRGRAVRYDEI